MKIRIVLGISIVANIGLLLFIYIQKHAAPPFNPFHVRTDFDHSDLISDGYTKVVVDVYMLGKTIGDLTIHYQIDEETSAPYWREAIIETHMKQIDTLGIYNLIESYDADIKLPAGMNYNKASYTPPLTSRFFVESRINHQIFECSLVRYDTTTYQISVGFKNPFIEPTIIDGEPYFFEKERKRFGPDTIVFEDGEKEIVNYWNWTQEGETISVRPNGKISGIASYKDGELQNRKGYYEDGTMQYDVLAYNKTGSSRWWYPNGTMLEEIEYEDGRQNGKYVSYYDNGKVWVTGQLADGSYDTAKRDGEWTFYDSLGRPERKEFYTMDSLIKTLNYQ